MTATTTGSGVAVADLEGLGLHPYQARVLLALLAGPGPADSVVLAERSGVPRTSVYAAADHLVRLGAARRVKGRSTTVWETAGWGQVLEALDANAAVAYQDHLDRSARIRGLTGVAR